MNRVFIAMALAVTMLFGSTAFAGNKSISIQFGAHGLSVDLNGHYQRSQGHYRQPQHWQRRHVAPRHNVHHATPRYRHAPRRVYRPAPRRIYKHAPRHHFKRAAPRHHFKRHAPRYNQWHHQQRRQLNRH